MAVTAISFVLRDYVLFHTELGLAFQPLGMSSLIFFLFILSHLIAISILLLLVWLGRINFKQATTRYLPVFLILFVIYNSVRYYTLRHGRWGTHPAIVSFFDGLNLGQDITFHENKFFSLEGERWDRSGRLKGNQELRLQIYSDMQGTSSKVREIWGTLDSSNLDDRASAVCDSFVGYFSSVFSRLPDLFITRDGDSTISEVYLWQFDSYNFDIGRYFITNLVVFYFWDDQVGYPALYGDLEDVFRVTSEGDTVPFPIDERKAIRDRILFPYKYN